MRPRITRLFITASVAIVAALGVAGSAHAAAPVPLGTADSFALLAGSTITNTGSTTISGDIGLCCTGIATTGFGPGADQVNQPAGAQYVGPGSPAESAQADLDVAYFDAAGRAVDFTVPVDLSLSGTPANPLRPGVYESTAHGRFQINTGLTLDFQGDPNAVFIFQGVDLVTAAGASGSVNIVNGGANATACNIYWQLSDATQGVTLGTASEFKGTTMSLGASVLGTGATVEGRILTRRSKAVNLDTNTITRSACFAAAQNPAPAPAPAGTPTPAATPTPAGTPPPAGAPAPGGTAAPGTPGPGGTAGPEGAAPTAAEKAASRAAARRAARRRAVRRDALRAAARRAARRRAVRRDTRRAARRAAADRAARRRAVRRDARRAAERRAAARRNAVPIRRGPGGFTG